MDLTTIATTLLTMATPFLLKAGDGTAQKIGESAWEFIQSKFNKSTLPAINPSEKKFTEAEIELIKHSIFKEIQNDTQLAHQTEQFINQTLQQGTMIVNQYGQKSVNMGQNLGNINIS